MRKAAFWTVDSGAQIVREPDGVFAVFGAQRGSILRAEVGLTDGTPRFVTLWQGPGPPPYGAPVIGRLGFLSEATPRENVIAAVSGGIRFAIVDSAGPASPWVLRCGVAKRP